MLSVLQGKLDAGLNVELVSAAKGEGDLSCHRLLQISSSPLGQQQKRKALNLAHEK